MQTPAATREVPTGKLLILFSVYELKQYKLF